MGKATRNKKKSHTIMIKKEKPAPLDPTLIVAYNRGKMAQEKEDIEKFVGWLGSLENVPGIGEKKATDIRMYFLQNF